MLVLLNALGTDLRIWERQAATLREEFWLATFAEAAAADTSLIFTFAPESTVAVGLGDRARRVVEDGGGRIHFVQLAVSDAEQDRRIDAPSRHEFAKLTDIPTLHRLRADGARGDVPPTDLLIDTESSTPDDAARLIIDTFGLVPVARHERYPVT